jgi:hypothetical protein
MGRTFPDNPFDQQASTSGFEFRGLNRGSSRTRGNLASFDSNSYALTLAVPEVARACLAALGAQLLSFKQQIVGGTRSWLVLAIVAFPSCPTIMSMEDRGGDLGARLVDD